jgi:hypothetical protein
VGNALGYFIGIVYVGRRGKFLLVEKNRQDSNSSTIEQSHEDPYNQYNVMVAAS